MLNARSCGESDPAADTNVNGNGNVGGGDFLQQQRGIGNEACTWIERVNPSRCRCVCGTLEGDSMQSSCLAVCGTCAVRSARGSASLSDAKPDVSIDYFEEAWTNKGLYLEGMVGLAKYVRIRPTS